MLLHSAYTCAACGKAVRDILPTELFARAEVITGQCFPFWRHVYVSCFNWKLPFATTGSCARSFYVRVLGFQRQPRPPFPFGGAWLTGGGLTLHLIDDDPTIPHAHGDWRVGPPRIGLYPNA